ncbi:UNVERIFIED_ORG: hypothetical protein ABIB19_003953 [Arthrobacter sp. UYEF10]
MVTFRAADQRNASAITSGSRRSGRRFSQPASQRASGVIAVVE